MTNKKNMKLGGGYLICACLSLFSMYLIDILSPLIRLTQLLEDVDYSESLFSLYALISILYFISSFLAIMGWEGVSKFFSHHKAEEGVLIGGYLFAAMPLAVCFSTTILCIAGGLWAFICNIPVLISMIYVYRGITLFFEELVISKMDELNELIKIRAYEQARKSYTILCNSIFPKGGRGKIHKISEDIIRLLNDISINFINVTIQEKEYYLAARLCNVLLNTMYQERHKTSLDITRLREISIVSINELIKEKKYDSALQLCKSLLYVHYQKGSKVSEDITKLLSDLRWDLRDKLKNQEL